MNYAAKITKEEEDFIVSFPDKPNVNTCGESLEHALEMAKEALNETLKCELDCGKHLVVPKIKENKKKNLYSVPVEREIETAYITFEARQGERNPALSTLNSIAKVLGKRLEIRLV